jgi:hypothetical protein
MMGQRIRAALDVRHYASAKSTTRYFPREGAEDTERSSPMSWELSQFRAGEVVEVRRAAGRLRTG